MAPVKVLTANAEDIRDVIWSLGWEDPLEEGMATWNGTGLYSPCP